MRFVPVIFLVAVFAHTKVAGDVLDCYTCEDNNCRNPDTIGVVRCYADGDGSELTTATSTPTTENPITINVAVAKATPNFSPYVEESDEPVNATDLSASSLLLRNYRGRARVRRATASDGTGYACYTVQYKDESSASRLKKGCVVIPVEESACTVIKQELGIDETERCNICLNDKCNSSATIQFSILTMTVLFCSRYLM